MKRLSELRARRLDAYHGRSRAQADYYQEVFDRWVAIYGPPVTFPPRYWRGRVVWQSMYAQRLANSLSADMERVAERILDVIPHDRTKDAFRQRVGYDGSVGVIYVRGKRYGLVNRSHERRIEEMLFCYAMLGTSAMHAEMGAKIAENCD